MIKKENSVFYISILLTTLFIIWGITPASWIQGYDLQSVTSSLNSFILNKFGWFYSLLMTAMIILAAYLAFSKYGSIRLGKDGEKPKYSYPSWLSMLFGAGMGIGLLFYGIAEPISHFTDPLTGKAGTEESAKLAMQYSFFPLGSLSMVTIRNGCFNNCIFHIPQTKKVAQLGLQLLHYLIDRKILLSEKQSIF
ncbi:BCCT family transporter [Bacillus paranthracis]